jgi:hypothetical protein
MSSTSNSNENAFKHTLGSIALLNSTNYATWKADCEQILYGIKAWKIVVEEEEEPENPDGYSNAAIRQRRAHEDYTTRRAQAGAIICGSCSASVNSYHNKIKDPVRMWKVLAERMDTASTAIGCLTLFRKFSQLRPVAGQPINSYFTQLLDIANQLAGTDEAIPDIVLKNHIFMTCPLMFKINIKMLQSRPDVTIQGVLHDLKECE